MMAGSVIDSPVNEIVFQDNNVIWDLNKYDSFRNCREKVIFWMRIRMEKRLEIDYRNESESEKII